MKALFLLLERLNLRTKLLLGSLGGVVLALVVSAYGLSGMARLEAEIERLYEKELLALAHLKEANLNMIYVSRQVRHMLISQDDRTRAEAKARLLRAREELMSELAAGRSRLSRPREIERYEQLERELTQFLESVEVAISMIEREKPQPSAAASYLTSPEFQMVVARADGALHELAQMTQKGSAESRVVAQRIGEETRWQATVLLLMGLAAALAFGTLIGASIQRPSEALRRSVEALAAGKVDAEIPHTDYPNEVGMLARAIHVLQGIYRQSNEQHWVKSHAAELTTHLQQVSDLPTLAQKGVSFLAPLVGAAHAAFYLHLSDQRSLRLLGTYGMTERKHLGNEFRMGEGVVGQCAMEASPILLTAPSEHIRINSGLGSSPAGSILVVPLKLGDRMWGVVELAALDQFDSRARPLMEACADVLARSVDILCRNPQALEFLSPAPPDGDLQQPGRSQPTSPL